MASNSGTSEDTVMYKRLTEDVFAYGSVSLALAMAQETGMTKILCQADGPLSSTDVAHQGKLKERYVREVLNGLTTAGLVQLEKGTGGKDGVEALYFVPEAHRADFRYIGIASTAISVCARRFPGVKECFDLDGPSCVRYNENTMNLFDEWTDVRLDNVFVAMLKTPGLKQRLEDGIEAMEVGAGLGTVSRRLAAMFPKTRFTITDIVPEAVEGARQRAQEQGLTNVTFEVLDACETPDRFKDRFDWVVIRDVIHDLPYPLKALQGVSKALKRGGHFSLGDLFFSSYVTDNLGNRNVARYHSLGTFLCIPESYQQPDSAALGPCWGEQKARQLLNAAGLKVLGFIRSGTSDMGGFAICMCEKSV